MRSNNFAFFQLDFMTTLKRMLTRFTLDGDDLVPCANLRGLHENLRPLTEDLDAHIVRDSGRQFRDLNIVFAVFYYLYSVLVVGALVRDDARVHVPVGVRLRAVLHEETLQ